MREDFSEGKPTLQMVLTKILPLNVLGLEDINENDIKDAAAEIFCPDIEFQFKLKEKMRSIERKISKIWNAENVGDVLEDIKEIGIELTETIDMLVKSVEETEESYIRKLKSLYDVGTVLGPKVKETIKSIGRIEARGRKIRGVLKSLGETTVEGCRKIQRALENLLKNANPKESDMKRMLRYTANLLKTSHAKLGESVTMYGAMTRELDELVVDLKTHDAELGKTANDAREEYTRQANKAKINMIASSIGTVFSFIGSCFGLSNGEFGVGDVVGPAAFVNNAHNLYSHNSGRINLNEYYSSRQSKLQSYRKKVQKYVKSSGNLKEILELEEKAAGEWHDIIKRIQTNLGVDLKFLSEDIAEKYEDGLKDARKIFGLLQEKAQNFLDLLAEKEQKAQEIQDVFKDDAGLTL